MSARRERRVGAGTGRCAVARGGSATGDGVRGTRLVHPRDGAADRDADGLRHVTEGRAVRRDGDRETARRVRAGGRDRGRRRQAAGRATSDGAAGDGRRRARRRGSRRRARRRGSGRRGRRRGRAGGCERRSGRGQRHDGAAEPDRGNGCHSVHDERPRCPGSGPEACIRTPGARRSPRPGRRLGGISRVCTCCSAGGKLGVSSDRYVPSMKIEPHLRPRRITLERVFNFRDLGGYAGERRSHGALGIALPGRRHPPHRRRRPRAGRGARDSHGARSPHAGRARLITAGSRPESIDAAYHHLPLLEQVWERDLPVAELDAVDFLAGRYLEMLDAGCELDRHRARRPMADAERLPLVFHCSAGKDRTGVLAAILLSVLGVSDDDIAADYALSRAAMRELAEWVRTERPESYETMASQPPAFLDAPPLAMRRFLAGARAQYGSLTDYVRRHPGSRSDGCRLAAIDAARLSSEPRRSRRSSRRGLATVGGHRLRAHDLAQLVDRAAQRVDLGLQRSERLRRRGCGADLLGGDELLVATAQAGGRCRAPRRCSGRAARRCGCRSSGP